MRTHYFQWHNEDGEQMECAIEFGTNTATVGNIHKVSQEIPPKRNPKQQQSTEDKPCKTCGVKSLKRLIAGGAKLLKSELGIDACDEKNMIDRKNICDSCEHYDFGVCNLCGCFCAAKVKLKSEICPDGRW